MNNSTTIAELYALIDWKWLIYILIILMGIVVTISIHYSTKKTKKKARQRAYIEKQLEKLYYPLINILNTPLPNLRTDEKELKFDLKKIAEIIPFKHLASDDFIEIEKRLKNEFWNGSIVADNRVEGNNYDISFEDFKEFVEADIKRLEEKLQSIKNSG